MKKHYLILSAWIIGLVLGYSLCHKQSLPKDSILIVPSKDGDGTPIFSVSFQDSNKKSLDYMRAEQITSSLVTGDWEYDENISIPLVSLSK